MHNPSLPLLRQGSVRMASRVHPSDSRPALRNARGDLERPCRGIAGMDRGRPRPSRLLLPETRNEQSGSALDLPQDIPTAGDSTGRLPPPTTKRATGTDRLCTVPALIRPGCSAIAPGHSSPRTAPGIRQDLSRLPHAGIWTDSSADRIRRGISPHTGKADSHRSASIERGIRLPTHRTAPMRAGLRTGFRVSENR